jgi:L,D-transpeptidase ErfK/SrfK
MKLFYSQYAYYLRNFRKRNSLLLFSLFAILTNNVLALEIYDLKHDSSVVGEIKNITINYSESVPDIANRFKTGYQDLLVANPNSHNWMPEINSKYVIPLMYILPQKNYNGIILNLAELRLYYYMPPTDLYETVKVLTYPVGIGRLDWKTPLGETFIRYKVKNPDWYPPKSIITEHEENGEILPRIVKSGPNNPLGIYALKLNVPGGYLLHGTNKKYGIGMKVSHGCIRLRNEDIKTIFHNVSIGTKVKIVDLPIKLGTYKNFLYMEVHAFNNQEIYSNNQKNFLTTNNIYKPVTPVMEFIEDNPNYKINWGNVFKAYKESRGVPVIIGKKNFTNLNKNTF